MADMSQASASTQATAPDVAMASGKGSRPVYEVGFHLVPSIAEDALAARVATIRGLLGDAEIISEEFPKKMTLAYVIERSVQGKREKFSNSYFGWIKFAGEREAVSALDAALGGMPDVLRFILIETTREDASQAAPRAVFASDRLEGQTIEKKTEEEKAKGGEVSQEELDKSIDALTS